MPIADPNRSYECVGGPWDGRFHVLHHGNELRIRLHSFYGMAVGTLTDKDITKPVEIRTGVYRLYTPKKKRLTYLKWMGEE